MNFAKIAQPAVTAYGSSAIRALRILEGYSQAGSVALEARRRMRGIQAAPVQLAWNGPPTVPAGLLEPLAGTGGHLGSPLALKTLWRPSWSGADGASSRQGSPDSRKGWPWDGGTLKFALHRSLGLYGAPSGSDRAELTRRIGW
jgi:hypothetical protein